MSNSFYHKDLTDAQWNRIKCRKEQAIGSSRGGKNTKIHVLSTRECNF